jgi:hypothetical protein
MLRRGLRAQPGRLFESLRRRLLEMEDVRESTAWLGYCWRWSLEYRVAGAAEPLAIIVPSPTDLQLAIPLDPELSQSIGRKRMGRALRDGLDLALEPFDTRWAVWSIQSMGMLDDLQDLLELKLGHLTKKVG